MSISATNFQRPCTREATESRSRRLSPAWAIQCKPPFHWEQDLDDHEDHLAVSLDSSEVRLTPRLQLRLNLVDRSRGQLPSGERSKRTPPWPAFSAQRKAHKAASAAPCRVPVDQPVKVRPAVTPRLACSAHTSMGRCDNQSEAASIVESHEPHSEEPSQDARSCEFSHPQKPTIAHSLPGGARKGRSVSS